MDGEHLVCKLTQGMFLLLNGPNTQYRAPITVIHTKQILS